MESPGPLPSEGLVFQLVCRFHRYWAYSSKSTVQPKMESCFQDRAYSVSSFTSSFPLILIFFFFPLCIFVWNVSADVPSNSVILYLSVSNLIRSPSDSSHLPACIIWKRPPNLPPSHPFAWFSSWHSLLWGAIYLSGDLLTVSLFPPP